MDDEIKKSMDGVNKPNVKTMDVDMFGWPLVELDDGSTVRAPEDFVACLRDENGEQILAYRTHMALLEKWRDSFSNVGQTPLFFATADGQLSYTPPADKDLVDSVNEAIKDLSVKDF